jgi:hypothetical protein
MKVKVILLVVLAIIVLNVTGCGWTKGLEAADNRKKIAKYNIQPGMAMTTFASLMGTPDKIEYIGDKQILIYTTAWIEDGESTDAEKTPFIFVNGTLEGVGWKYYKGLKQ